VRELFGVENFSLTGKLSQYLLTPENVRRLFSYITAIWPPSEIYKPGGECFVLVMKIT
jgi:hypothetical protein